MPFAIEVESASRHGNPTLLRPSRSESGDSWQTEEEAMQAIDGLVAGGCDLSRLTVVEIDSNELGD